MQNGDIVVYSYLRCRYLPGWAENNHDKPVRVVYAACWTQIESSSISRIKVKEF